VYSDYYNKKNESNVNSRILGEAEIFNFPSGGNFSIKKKTFFELGGFDENFEAFEDWDLILRTLRKGYYFYLNPSMRVTHLLKESINKNFRRYFFYGVCKTSFLKKNFHKKFCIHIALKFNKNVCKNFFTTFYIRVDLLKILFFLSITYLISTTFFIFLVSLLFLFALVELRSISAIPFFFVYVLLSDIAFTCGHIAGSIKNRIICI